jgi:hypothetical protein
MTEPIKISRNDFMSQLATAKLSVADLKADPRMTGVDAAKADLDGDGKISGKKELRALFDEVDRLDTNGSSESVTVVDKGSATATAAPMAAIGDLGRAGDIQRKANAASAGNDDILFIGMRDATSKESDALAKRGKSAGYNVTVIGQKSDVVSSGGKDYDMSTDAGMRGFADSLGLPKDRADQVYAALQKNPKSGRAELAQLAMVLNKGENGGTVPSRLVISGHHAGGEFMGDRGWLNDGAVQDMARAFPKGAAQVEDLHLAGCYAYGRNTMAKWTDAFPSLQTAWGYDHTAPGADSGATLHQSQWDSATRGRVGILNRSAAKGLSVDDEVLVWSKQGGYQGKGPPKSLDDLKKEVKSGESAYQNAFDGTTTISNPHEGSVRDYYNSLNDLRQHPDLPVGDRAAIDDKIDRTIRLLYTKDVNPGWATANSATLDKGYKAAGLDKPDFSKMNRKEALTAIDKYLKATDGKTDPDIVATRARMNELKTLDPVAIHKDWIH